MWTYIDYFLSLFAGGTMWKGQGGVGSEQALAPVRLPDTFAEGAWDKVPKTKGTFDFVSQTTIVLSF
jgi:hypothetical protein